MVLDVIVVHVNRSRDLRIVPLLPTAMIASLDQVTPFRFCVVPDTLCDQPTKLPDVRIVPLSPTTIEQFTLPVTPGDGTKSGVERKLGMVVTACKS